MQAEEHEEEPIGEFADLSKYSFNKQVRFLSLKNNKNSVYFIYIGIDNGKQEAKEELMCFLDNNIAVICK